MNIKPGDIYKNKRVILVSGIMMAFKDGTSMTMDFSYDDRAEEGRSVADEILEDETSQAEKRIPKNFKRDNPLRIISSTEEKESSPKEERVEQRQKRVIRYRAERPGPKKIETPSNEDRDFLAQMEYSGIKQ